MDTYGQSVKAHGAIGDGVADDGPAIQAALDAGVARVVVPYGHYLVRQGLRIGSDTHLVVHPQASIRFADGAGKTGDDFLLTNKDHVGGNHAIVVEGGIWDGNNPGNPRGPDEPGSHTGVMMNFTNVKGLTVRSMTLQDAESYFVRFGKVYGFLVEDIAFEIRHLRPNQDGIHLSGYCEDGIIRRLFGRGTLTPNDDMAAILADDALGRAQNQNGAFNGPIRRIRVEHLRAASCHSFVRLLSVDNPIEDVEITDVVGGCRNCAINMDAARDCRVTLFDDADRPEGVGSITNIRVSDMTVFKATNTNNQPLIDFRTHADDFVIDRFARDATQDVSPATPTLHIEKSGVLGVVLDGLAAPMDGAGLFEVPTAQPSYRVSRTMDADESLTLQSGGFTRLQARRG